MQNMNFTLFYAERFGNQEAGEPYIAEQGIFMSLEEFLPYRKKGWEARKEINEATDILIAEEEK